MNAPGTRFGLTPREGKVLNYLHGYIGEHGYAPSYREIGQHLGYAESNLTSPVHQVIEQLERKYRIRRLPNRARAIELLPHTIIIHGEPYRFIPWPRKAA